MPKRITSENSAKLRLIGASDGVVTGSKSLLEYKKTKVLIDYGLYQGAKDIRALNRSKYQFNPKDIDCIILTHAHIDHSGLIPKIIKDGFKGSVLCTQETKEICKVLFEDAAYLMAKEYERKSYDKSRLPLYDEFDAKNAINSFEILGLNKHKAIGDIEVIFRESGHILGSVSAEILLNHHTKIYFTGDLGNYNQLLSKETYIPKDVDYLIVESTYGNRAHPEEDVISRINDCIEHIRETKGVLVIPCFAVARTQEMLLNLYKYSLKNKIKIYLDSPMAQKVTELYLPYINAKLEENNLDLKSFREFYSVTKTPLESKFLCEADGPFVVLTASGMLMGGRIMHHLKSRLSNKKNALLFTGYQPPQSKGDLIKNGISHIKIFGDLVEVNAKVSSIESLSAHADSNQLVHWAKVSTKKNTKVFINHGTTESANALLFRLKKELGLDAKKAASNEINTLNLNSELFNGKMFPL